MDKVPSHFSLVGGVAVISIPLELEGQKKAIGEAIISGHKNVKTVLRKISKLEGERRTASFEFIAGGGTVTCHREFGFSYRLDVARVFFNPRLGSERMRVASKVRPGERAIVPFAGVGPFAIPIAAAGAQVLALEISPEACRWLSENARHNRVGEMADIVNCDAFAVCGLLKENGLKTKFDRAVVPTPYGRDDALDSISPIVKPGGAIHFYTFKKRRQIEDLIREFEERGFEVEFHRRCGNVAPGVGRWVFDLVKF
ncbi:MAG TPA: class I SAM-dependent methyltransferase family protein [Methanothrix sp.]|nr:class I SAM-dependent methyltransferase family protein [Methanothrix sp.]HPR67064.1 class I SAM-dependent methyltransferase family protein [Methanothrix sp.]